MATPHILSASALHGLVLVAWLGAAGCTKFASDLDTPSDSPGMQTLELDPGDWTCVGDEAGSPVMNPNGPPLRFAIDVRDYLTGAAPTNLRVRACFRPDLACTRPATDWLTPDAAGVLEVPVNEGFSGYLEITGDDEVPTLYMLPIALTPELATLLESVTISLLPPDILLVFATEASLDLDPGAGVVSMNTFDCAGPSAPGVRLELNAAAVPFSFIAGLPVAFAETTTDDGAAGFVNVLPGLVVVKGYRADTTELVGLETVLVRAGWVSVGNLMPQFASRP